MIELKPGNGGYGLEAYDTNTGKYASNVSVSLEDEDTGEKYNFSNFKDFLKQIYGNQFLQTYEEDEEFRKMIHEYKGENGIWQTWEKLLTQEVNRLNAEEEARNTNVEFYATATEVADNAHKFFTKELIDEMFEKNLFSVGTLNYTKDGSGSGGCNGIAELFRIARYGKTKMKPITEQEFYDKCGVFATTNMDDDYQSLYNRIQEVIASKNKCIPIYRGMRMHDLTKDKIALASHYKTDFHPSESIYFTGSGYYGSVIYMSGSQSYVSDWGYAYNKKYLHAYVELNDEYKIAFCPSSQHGNQQMELFKRYEYKTFVRNLETSMKNMGYNSRQINDVSRNVENQIKYNVGFVAMLFGYDGLCGEDGQFDQLNMAKIKCVDEGWF
jgi:hypothetical protein